MNLFYLFCKYFLALIFLLNFETFKVNHCAYGLEEAEHALRDMSKLIETSTKYKFNTEEEYEAFVNMKVEKANKVG